jgi:hypothetical protein
MMERKTHSNIDFELFGHIITHFNQKAGVVTCDQSKHCIICNKAHFSSQTLKETTILLHFAKQWVRSVTANDRDGVDSVYKV